MTPQQHRREPVAMIQTKILGHAGVAYSGDEQITFYIILKLDFLRYKFSGTEVKNLKAEL